MDTKKCKDYYGQELKIGDRVIPIISEALVVGIKGIITNIEYHNGSSYITISDEKQNVIIKNVNSEYYSTFERYNTHNQKAVYDILFCNKRIGIIDYLPLTNKTDENYKLPDTTKMVIIKARHLVKKLFGEESYSETKIYVLYVDNEFCTYFDKKENKKYLYMVDIESYGLSAENFKAVKDVNELKKITKSIITYFKNSDLTNVNNDKEIGSNLEGMIFERKLVNKIKES